jgi:hypothetical protein
VKWAMGMDTDKIAATGSNRLEALLMARLSKLCYRIQVLSLVCGALLCVPQQVDACTCVTGSAVCEDFWKTAAVFRGRVETISRLPSKNTIGLPLGRRVTFTVLEPFRGATGRTLDLRTGSGGGDCGYPFKEGVEYLVFASMNESTGELATGICSKTKPASDAEEDLAYARAVASGAAAAGRITGEIKVADRSLAHQPVPAPRPMDNVGVRLERNGIVSTTESDAAGRFTFEALTAGKYDLSITVPERYYTVEEFPKSIELPDVRACATAQATLRFDGRVKGRVVNARGQPIEGLTVELTVPGGLEQPIGPERIRAMTNREGAYELTRVPPGRFVVGLNMQRDREGGLPLPRILHPGVERVAEATRVTLGGGDRVALRDFVVPAEVSYVQITGIVLAPDGALAPGALVYLKGPSSADYILTGPAVADDQGRFVVSVLSGREYRIFAERTERSGRTPRIESSDQVSLTGVADLPPITLSLRRRY